MIFKYHFVLSSPLKTEKLPKHGKIKLCFGSFFHNISFLSELFAFCQLCSTRNSVGLIFSNFLNVVQK